MTGSSMLPAQRESFQNLGKGVHFLSVSKEAFPRKKFFWVEWNKIILPCWPNVKLFYETKGQWLKQVLKME